MPTPSKEFISFSRVSRTTPSIMLYHSKINLSKNHYMRLFTINTLILAGDKDSLAQFKQRVNGANGSFDFNKIVPIPDNLSYAAADTDASGSIPSLDEWLINNWGSVGQPLKTEVINADTSLTYIFATIVEDPLTLVNPVAQIARSLGLEITWKARCDDGTHKSTIYLIS